MRRTRWILAALILGSSRFALADANADKVVECMRANIPPTVRIQTVEITSWDRTGGERKMRGRLFGTNEKGRVKVMLRIEAPQDLAGAAYLVREGEKSDEMYLYLPAVKKVRRITGASLDGQLWGTDISYNDLKQIQNAFTGAAVTAEAPAAIDGHPVHVVSFHPRKEDGSRYRTIRAQVDQKTCVALTVDFLEPAGIRKQLAARPADLKHAGEYWYTTDADMRDLKNGTHTRVQVLGVSSGDKLAARYFNPQTFYLGN